MVGRMPEGRGSRLERSLTAARQYYLAGRTMDQIARSLGTSRSTVSRLLVDARETGIVDIRIQSPDERSGVLERRIRERHGITAHVVPSTEAMTEVERLDGVAARAAHILTRHVESNMVVGLAWGSTMSVVSRMLPPKETRNTVVVQLNGAGNTQSTGVDYSSEILRRFGDAFSARVEQFPVPAFFDDPATREAMWRERSTQRVLGLQSRMDLALFSLGTPAASLPSRVYVGGYLSQADYRSLREDRVIGDLATVFFRADGSWRDIRLNARATGPDPERILRVPRRVCVAAGTAKAASLRAALAAGFVTDLVVDESLADALLDAGR